MPLSPERAFWRTWRTSRDVSRIRGGMGSGRQMVMLWDDDHASSDDIMILLYSVQVIQARDMVDFYDKLPSSIWTCGFFLIYVAHQAPASLVSLRLLGSSGRCTNIYSTAFVRNSWATGLVA
jgi:hypothetical protein